MRRKDRAITDEEATKLLRAAEYGILSTASKDGVPYGIPLSFCLIDNAIYFHSATEGQKLDHFKENNQVSFCVVGKTEVLAKKFTTNYESTIVSGDIEESFGKDKELGLMGLVKKYSPEFENVGLRYIKDADSKTRVFKINIKKLAGKARR